MIHRYWSGPAPSTEPWIGNTLRQFGSLKDWTDRTLPASVVAWLDEHAGQVRAEDALRHRANLVRWWILSEHGGVWVDHDVIAFEDLSALRRPFCAAHSGTPCTSVLGFDPGHPVPLAALEAINSAPLVAERATSPAVSGERLLARILTPDVQMQPLPFDSNGRREGRPWAVHMYASAGRSRRSGTVRA